jgi:FkbH-like protein
MSGLDLYWLPDHPQWRDALAGVSSSADGAAWQAFVKLAGYQLDSLATLRLDRRLTSLFPDPPAWLANEPVRVALLASSTVDHLLPALRIGALRRNIHLSIYVGEYGQYSRELMDSGSALHRWKPDLVLFAMDAHHLLNTIEPRDSLIAAEDKVEAASLSLVQHWRLAREAFGCRVVQQTVLPVFPMMLGNNEQRLPGSRARAASAINTRLRELADDEGVDLLAVDAWAARDGLRAWHDPVLWHRAKQEIHPTAAPLYGDLFGRLLSAQQGRSRKCLVLDLDNTLWGGVIGDDGLGGIVLGQGSALGEAFSAFQACARAYAQRGIILAVCSKNDESNAFEPFEKHPEMMLKRGDIACFVANWTDKAANIREIAAQLNIGIDSLVFVDDNPFERELVRQTLPMVAVPEMPEDPALWPECLADAGYFESVRLTEEDRDRARQYRLNRDREALKSASTDIESYLRGLNMELLWAPFEMVDLSRIVQLINKTNQFNLTTRRTTEEVVTALMADERALSLQLRLIDRFGDNGIIAIVTGRLRDGTRELLIDTWLMSCRVLGRRVEDMTLNLIAEGARRLGADHLVGEYRPTAKNAMVSDLYPRLGFQPHIQAEDGTTSWILPLDSFAPIPCPITVLPTHSEPTI